MPGLAKKQTSEQIYDSRAVEAFKLRAEGKPLWEIAEEMDLTESEVVHLINNRMKTERSLITTEERQGIIAIQQARYETIIRANWQMMVNGDDKAANIVLKAMAQLEGLNKLHEVDPEASKSTVLVIGGAEQSYIQALKEASGQ